MNKLIDISVGIILFIISIILWLYTLLIAYDIPMNIDKKEFIISLVSLLLFGLIYSFYIINSKRKTVSALLLIPLVFWFSDMINAIQYNYQTYHTILTVIGFTTTVYCIGLSIYKLITCKKIV